jgi:hypothetical protein
MFTLDVLVLSLVVPALMGFGTAWLASRCRGPFQPISAGVLVLGLGLAVLVGEIGVTGWPGFFPLEAWGWVHVFALAALGVGLVESAWPPPTLARWVIRLLVARALVGLILRPLVPDTFEVGAAAVRWGGLDLAILIVWGGLEGLADRLRGPALPLSLGLVGLGIAVGLVMSGSLRLGQLGLTVAAVLAGVSSASVFARELSLARGPLAVLVIVWAALLLNGTFYADLPESSVILFAVAPLAGWVGQIGPLRRRGGWLQTLAMVLAVAVPAGLAVGLAVWSSPSLEY